MALCGFLGLVIGFLAGLRFRVMIVIPIEMVACVVAATSVAVGQASLAQACLGVAIAGVAVQVGYGLALARPLMARASVDRGPVEA